MILSRDCFLCNLRHVYVVLSGSIRSLCVQQCTCMAGGAGDIKVSVMYVLWSSSERKSMS